MAWWSAHPRVVQGRGHTQYHALAPDSLLLLPALQKWQLCVGAFFMLLLQLRQHVSRVCLCDLMDCSLPGSSVHGISQASPTGEYALLLFVPYHFYFAAGEDIHLRTSTTAKGPGPRAQSVSSGPQGLPTRLSRTKAPGKSLCVSKPSVLTLEESRGPSGLDRAALQSLGKLHFLPGPQGSGAMAGSLLESGTNTEMSQGDGNEAGRGPCVREPN